MLLMYVTGERYEVIMQGNEAVSRQLLLAMMTAAERVRNQRVADMLLVEATRWLRNYPYDAVIWEARQQLRTEFPPLH